MGNLKAKLSSELQCQLKQFQSQLGAGIEIRKTRHNEWLLLDRNLPFNDASVSTRDEYLGIRCHDWSVGEINKDLFETSPNPRFLLEFESEEMRGTLVNEIQLLIDIWEIRASVLSEDVRVRLGYDQTEARQRERSQSVKRQEANETLIATLKRELLCIRSQTWEELSKLVEFRGVRYLVHFTRFENLMGIFQQGLLPNAVRRAMKLNTPWQRTDWLRIDGLPEASCLSVSRPNHLMFNRKRSEGGDWVVLGFDAIELLKLPSIFIETNAARGGSFKLEPQTLCKLATPSAFERMFSVSPLSGNDLLGVNRGSNHTRDPQAEILVFDVIEPSLLSFVALSRNRYDEQLHSVKDFAPSTVNFLQPASALYEMMFDAPPRYQRLKE